MIKSFAAMLIGSVVVFAAAHARGDELFSRMSMNSAFNTPAGATDKAPATTESEAPERGRRLLSISQLADLLRELGLEPETKGDQVALVKYEHSRWKFQVVAVLSGDFEHIQVGIPLSQFDGQKQPSADRLLGLLAANRENQPAFFTYDSEQKAIVLLTTMNNDQISPTSFRAQLEQLSKIAENTADLWETDGKSLSVGNLSGKWSAGRSANEGFALMLNTDGSFTLVSVKNGQQTKSVGRFAVATDQLTLTASDGTKLAGKLANLKPDSFEFAPLGPNAAKLNFTRAK